MEADQAQGFNWRGFLTLGLIAAVLGGVGYWGWDQLRPESESPLGVAEEIGEGTVRYFSERGLYLVRAENGEFLALDHRDTGPGSRGVDCAVAWRPDLAEGAGQGLFFGRCTGSLWDAAGVLVRGSSPRGLDRYAVKLSDRGEVRAHRERLLCGPPVAAMMPAAADGACDTK